LLHVNPAIRSQGQKTPSGSDIELKESSSKHWNSLVAEEVKAISECVSQVKIFIDQSGDSVSQHFSFRQYFIAMVVVVYIMVCHFRIQTTL
jgi:hypothetical protein